MSRRPEDVQAEAEQIRRKRLEAAGLADQYDSWRESLPNARIPDNEVYEMFMNSQVVEEAASSGRLSVSTNGQEDILGADIPTPSPDGEEDGPDDPGDASEDTTSPEPIEGMWIPPKEAEAENYEAPTTHKMSRSAEWVQNARQFHEFMGSPPIQSGTYQPDVNPHLPKEKKTDYTRIPTNDEMGQWAREQLSAFNWNVMNTMDVGQKIMSANDPKAALAFLNLVNMYDHSDGGAAEFGSALGEIAMDPTTYLGLGVGSAVAKGIAKATAKAGLKKAIQMAIVGGTAGAIEGGTLAGGFDLTVQNVEQEAGSRDEIDYGRAATATGMGVGLGTLLGGVGGRWAGRKMDKFAAAVEAERLKQAGLANVTAERGTTELGEKELMEMLHVMADAGDKAGQPDLGAQAAQRILGDDGQFPRLEDGSVDWKTITKHIDDVNAEHTAKVKADRARAAELVDGPDMDAPVGGVKTEQQLSDYMDKVHKADNDWLYEWETGDLYRYSESGDYAKFQELADEMGLDHSVGSKEGGAEAFSLDSGTPAEKAEFVRRARSGGDSPDQIIPYRNQEIGTAGYEENGFKGHPATAEAGRTLNDNSIAVKETTRDSIVIDADEIIGNYGHLDVDIVGPMIKMAEDMGLRAELKDPGNLTITGDPKDLERFSKGAVDLWEAPADQIQRDLENTVEGILRKFRKTDVAANDPEMGSLREREGGKAPEPLPVKESTELQRKITELQELEKGDVVMPTSGRPGSTVVDKAGNSYELVGRTKNGWYHLKDSLGRESSKRRKDFTVTDRAPAPKKAGPMELDPFSDTAAKIIHLNEQVVSGKLKEVRITHAETQAIVDDLQKLGVKITDKELESHWTHADLMFLRNTYNAQALGMADLSRQLQSKLDNEGALTHAELAGFNAAHAQFVATRDLFFGVSGNAARQLNILRSRPTSEVYNFNQAMMDAIAIQGGRANTERAIKLMAEFASKKHGGGPGGKGVAQSVSELSQSIWGNQKAAAILNVRYNMMLSSWRTHFFNFLGNSVSGVYQHLMASPVRMGINNMAYARDLARSVIQPNYKPDPADRLTRHQWYAELRGHYAGFRDSLALSKEIAMGRDIGEGKVWNELGLRYNVINVPDSAFAKLGTSPVRLLEAGDAFFKNQYYNSKIHEMASIRARTEEVHGVTTNGSTYETIYNHYVDNPDGAMQRTARDFAAKQTYTNDPSIYGGVLAALAKGVSTAQNRSLAVNMIVPFVRTPANLLSYSMEMIGANIVLSPAKTYNAIMKGSAQESQEAMARLTVAAGLWLSVAEMYENGDITGTGPSNWEERKVWEAAGWQSNSIKIHGQWVEMSRAAPAGQSLATIASIFDYYAMTQQQEKPAMEWIGAGLLYTADMIIDESYLSTASDIITAISSKEESRVRAAGASMINSILVPNLLRDLRRPADETMRSGSSTNLLDQVHKQAMNASPWHSSDLPPKRDWKGDPVNYWGNAYARSLIPFNVRDPAASDPASMAIAYARIPVSTPNKTIEWPGGLGDSIDLFAMDNGGGYVYDKYLETMGKMRQYAVAEAMRTDAWKRAAYTGDTGPGSMGDLILRKALGEAGRLGRMQMLQWLIGHSGSQNTYHRKDGEGKDVMYQIHHQVSPDTYLQLHNVIRDQGLPQPEGTEQYKMKKSVEGPEFFKP